MAYTYEYPHPSVTTDIVIFTIRHDELKVLLIKRGMPPYQGMWALPGGFVDMDEDLEEGARRELEEETGVSDVFLEQLYTFGAPDRDPRERVITVAYYALIPTDEIDIKAGSDAEGVSWIGMQELPELAFDHAAILDMAFERLSAKLEYSTIALQFMPREFTLSELQHVYEVIHRKPMDKRNFRKRILGLDLVEDTGKDRRDGAHRPAKLYRAKDPGRIEIIK
ncbi:MAG: NUDIX domain-containing protein [Woeseiaceae bacterium]|nr:NUDIX domain-containing protein [Woeseiaceae bacterium]